jgi:hypothetical protein
MIEGKHRMTLPVAIVVAAALGGCIGPVVKPDFMSPAFDPSQVDTIYLMPTLVFASFPVPDLDESIWKGTRAHFQQKKYDCVRLRDKSLIDGLARDDIGKANPPVLAKAGPPEARYLLFFALAERPGGPTPYATARQTVLGGLIVPVTMLRYDFDLTAYLLDRTRGELLWSNREDVRLQSGPFRPAQREFRPPTTVEAGRLRDGVILGAARAMNGFPYKR